MSDTTPSSEQEALFQWLEQLDQLDQQQALSELVEHLDTIEPPTLEPEEIDRLEELGKELATDLIERDAIPDLPAMDMDERLLEPEQTHGPDDDHDR